MPFSSKSLRVPLNIVFPEKWRVVIAVITWFGFSYAAFALVLGIAESFRLMSGEIISDDYFILTESDMRYRAFFLALITSSISFGYVFRPFVDAALLRNPKLRRIRISISTDLWSLNLFVMFVFGKVGMVYLHFGQMDSSMWLGPDEYWRPVLILLPIVVFVHQWTTINRAFRLAGVKAMLTALAGVLVFSFLMSLMPPFDGSRINATLMRRSPSSYIESELPMPGSEANPRFQRSAYTAITLNIGRDRNSTDKSFGIFSNYSPFQEIDTADIKRRIRQQQNSYPAHAWPDISVQIAADKRTPMKLIKSLKTLIASNSRYSVCYAVYDPNKRFTPNKTSGYFQRIDNYSKHSPERPERSLTDAVLIEIGARRITFDRQPVSRAEVYSKCINYIADGHGQRQLLLYVGDDVMLADYLAAYNEILRAYNDLRDEAVSRKFHVTYRPAIKDRYSYEQEIAHGLETIPFTLTEISDRERSRLPK